MTDSMHSTVVTADLGIAQVVVATLSTAMIIGLGLFRRPSRAALLWSLAFVIGMVGTWVTLSGESLAVEAVRRAGLGIMLGAPVLIWSGFRARRQAPAFAWLSPLHATLAAVAFVLAGDGDGYSVIFRIAFFCTAVYAGLTLLELRRSPDRYERLATPLTLASIAFVVLGVFGLVSGLVFPAPRGDELTLVRSLNSLGMLVYLVCTTVTLLFFTSVSPVGVRTASTWPQFAVTATDRLARARAGGETSWVLLCIRIDDPDDIRTAAGESVFSRISDRFEETVRGAFPAEADIGRESRGNLAVLLSRPGPVVREHVRVMLRAITEIDAAEQISLHLSASVGWAPADVVGYDFPALLAAGQRAVSQASDLGGDRWERIEF